MAIITYIEEYAFSAAHRLPDFPDGDRDRSLHGHVWTVEIHVQVEVGLDGYAFDQARLDEVAEMALCEIDHSIVNDVAPALQRGLNEDIARWLAIQFMVALEIAELGGQPWLERIVLGQFSADRSRRLVHHKRAYLPTAQDTETARAIVERAA